jgi:hypothetical protein
MNSKSLKSNAILSTGGRLAFFLLLSFAAYYLVPSAAASDPGSGDWPMWGGTPDRNMI